MVSLSTHERFVRMFEHREADRIPIVDVPWEGTIARWHHEGMPEGVDWRDHFGVDKTSTIEVDISPRYEEKVLERTEDYTIRTSPWGVTMKVFNAQDSTPEFLDFKVTDAAAWTDAKRRMTVSRDRIDWKRLAEDHTRWRAEGQWIEAGFWFGFDVTHSWMVGTETVLVAMAEEPEWVREMFEHSLDQCIAHFEMVWDAGFRFDAIFWPDDMGFKNTTFFSRDMYRELLMPVHRRAVEWAHAKGIRAHLHSCGFIRPLVPDLVEIGIDALNPIERKAGMDVLELKRTFGDRLVLHGGIDATLWNDRERILAEVDALVPRLKENGGYVFSSDHSIPNSVGLEDFRAIVGRVKAAGRYG